MIACSTLYPAELPGKLYFMSPRRDTEKLLVTVPAADVDFDF